MTDPAGGGGVVRSLIATLGPEETAQVTAYGSRRIIDAGTIIVKEGGEVDDLNIVISGHAEVVLFDPTHGERQVAVLGPGDAIGEMSLLTGERASATVRATTPMELLTYARATIGDVLRAFPDLERGLAVIVAERLARMQRRLVAPETRIVHLASDGSGGRHLAALVASIAWHANQSVVGVTLDGQGSGADVVQIARQAAVMKRGAVAGVTPSTLGALDSVAADLSGDCAAIVVCAPAETFVPRAALKLAAVSTLEPTNSDRDAIERGRLAPISAYGDDVGIMARHAIGRRVGIAFGAGSARGFAHAGVIDVLRRHHVRADAVAGTSIGAAVAGLVALGRDGDFILHALERAGRLVVRPTLSRCSLFSVRHLAQHFAALAGDQRIENLPIPTALIAADLDSGEEVVFRRGLLRTAVLASIAIPGVYPPQHIGGRRLIDGAVVDPVPAAVVGELGADVVIAVKLATRSRQRVEVEATSSSGRSPWIPQVMLRSIDVMSNTVARALPGQATVVIEPSFAGAGGALSDFRRGGERLRALGVEAAEAVLGQLGRHLPWVGTATA